MPVIALAESIAGQGKVLWVNAGVSFPTDWSTTAFDDSAWSAPILQTLATLGDPIGTSDWITDSAVGHVEFSSDLFRIHFTLTAVAGNIVMSMAADNLIGGIWINGHLLGRNMAGSAVGAAIGVYPGMVLTIPASMLVAGDNVIAAQVYNGEGPTIDNPISLSFEISALRAWLVINEPVIGLTDRSNYLYIASGAQHNFSSQLRQRGQAEIELRVPAGDSYSPVRMSPLYLNDETILGYMLSYTGLIMDIEDSFLDNSGTRVVKITVVSLESVFDTVYAPPYQYQNKTCGYIARDLLERLEGGCPVTAGIISDGPVIPLFNTNFEKIADIFSVLATTAQFTWGVDPATQQFFFCSPTDLPGPPMVHGDILFDSIRWKQTGADYRNRQGIRLSPSAFPHSMEFFVGAGQKNFTLSRPVNQLTNAYATLSTCNVATGTLSANPADGDTVSISVPTSAAGYGWVQHHIYGLGGIIVNSAGFVHVVVQAGISKNFSDAPVGEPQWKNVITEQTTDGPPPTLSPSVIWKCLGPAGLSTGNDVYTFKTTIDNREFGHVLIDPDGDHTKTCQNLMDAINVTESRNGVVLRGVKYSLPTWENSLCNAISRVGAAFTLQQKAAGTGWISALSKSSSVFSWSSPVTTGGTSPQGSLGPNEGATISIPVYVKDTSTAAPGLSYTPGSAEIALATPLNVGSNLNVEYTRAGGDVIEVENTADVAVMAAITHGTGKFQQITDAASTGLIATSLEAGLQYAQKALAAYSVAPKSLSVRTQIPGYRIGMTIDLSLLYPVVATPPSPIIAPILSASWFIEEINAELFPYKKNDQRFGHYIFTLRLVNKEEIGSYLTFWQGLGGGSSGAGGGAGSASSLVATSGGAVAPSGQPLQFIICTQATFPVLDASNADRFIYVKDYAHVIYWNGTTPKFADDGNCFIEGFEIDPAGPGWALCDGSVVSYLNPDGTLTSHTTKNLVGSPAYAKYGATATGINAAVPAAITGNTAPAVTGATIGDTTGTIDAGDGTHGSDTFVTSESLIDPGHSHARGTLVNDSTGEPPSIQLRPWFRL